MEKVKPSLKGFLAQNRKLLKTAIIILVLCFAVVAFFFLKNSFFSNDSSQTITGTDVKTGDITVSISGSGTVEPIEQYEIQSVAKGDIIADNVTVGKKVNKDDLLYKIDSTDAQSNIEKARISLEKEQLSYKDLVNQTNDSKTNLTVKVPISGVITNLYVKNGDTVNANTKIADIVNSDSLILKLPFIAQDAKSLYISQSANIYLDKTNERIYGKITKISSGTYATSGGAQVSDVEITFINPGAVKTGDTATATAGGYACNTSGSISYSSSETVYAKTSGDVYGLNVSTGDAVKKGATLLRLDSDSDSSINIKSSQLSLKDSQLSLQNMIDQLDDYSLTSPISGTIIDKTYKLGDTLDGNKSSLAIVADMSKLTFTMDIDELDIESIITGQQVKITADALPSASFTGVIDNISIIGSTSNGVTTYPVKVVISDYKGLLPGMNVNAEIVSQEVKNVLKIPVSTVSRGNLVLVTEEYAKSVGAVKLDSSYSDWKEQFQESSSTSKSSGGSTAKSSNSGKASSAASGGNAAAASGGGNAPTASGGSSTARQNSAGTNTNTTSAGKTSNNSTGSSASGELDANKVYIITRPNTPKGYVWIHITTGLTDGDFIEVKSGLTADAKVYTVTVKTKTSSKTTSSGSSGMAMGGMGGGPMGGGPMDGGGSSNRSSSSSKSSSSSSSSSGSKSSGGGMG